MYLFIILYTMQINFPSEVVKCYCVVYVIITLTILKLYCAILYYTLHILNESNCTYG